MKESVLLSWESAPWVGERGSRDVTLKRSHFSWVLESAVPPLGLPSFLPPTKTDQQSTYPCSFSAEAESDQPLNEAQSRTRNSLLSFCFSTSSSADT